MDAFFPSAAIPAGSLARTYEYRTPGVHATPHLHWSLALKDGATISCPILVAEQVVYVGDSAGFFSALDARSGEVRWRFATVWTQRDTIPDPAQEDEEVIVVGVTAFCLAGAVGYVVDAQGTLAEIELGTGRLLRSWDLQALTKGPDGEIDAIYSLLWYEQRLLISTSQATYRLALAAVQQPSESGPTSQNLVVGIPHARQELYYSDLTTPQWSVEADPIFENLVVDIPNARTDVPTLYHPVDGRPDVIFGFEMVSQSGDIQLSAVTLSPDNTLWYASSLPNEEDPRDVSEEVGDFSLYRVLVLDEILYLFSDSSWDGEDEVAGLVALDPFTGAVQWRCACQEGVFQLAGAYHLVFLVSEDQIEAIDVQTHQRRWSRQAPAPLQQVLIADGLLFVLGKAGQIIALDAHTGEQRWNWQSEQPIKGRFSTMADATLYVVMGHTLYALS